MGAGQYSGPRHSKSRPPVRLSAHPESGSHGRAQKAFSHGAPSVFFNARGRFSAGNLINLTPWHYKIRSILSFECVLPGPLGLSHRHTQKLRQKASALGIGLLRHPMEPSSVESPKGATEGGSRCLWRTARLPERSLSGRAGPCFFTIRWVSFMKYPYFHNNKKMRSLIP